MTSQSNAETRRKAGLPELLLPSGNPEKLKAALLFGADAVYFSGEQYGLRAGKTGFSDEELQQAIHYTHNMGARAYITLNILAHEDDLSGLAAYVAKLEQYGADAVIISDPGVLSVVKEAAPGLELHLSTQASTTNSASCNFWYQQGVKRIVLARELTLDEIRRIRQNIPEDLELEAFVHGAMCMAYSGRCLLSNALTGRDANRGECAQPCRWSWKLSHEGQDDELYIEADERGSYFFNSRDLCLVNHVPDLVQAGINSFKIEGRMKGAFYAATTAKVYREAIDHYAEVGDDFTVNPAWHEELDLMVHRTYDTGFYFDRPSDDPKIDTEKSYHRVASVCGRVIETNSDQRFILCEQRNKLALGETIDLIRPVGPNLSLTIRQLYDEAGEPIEATPHATMRFTLSREDLAESDQAEVIPEGSFLRRLGNKDIKSAKPTS